MNSSAGHDLSEGLETRYQGAQTIATDHTQVEERADQCVSAFAERARATTVLAEPHCAHQISMQRPGPTDNPDTLRCEPPQDHHSTMPGVRCSAIPFVDNSPLCPLDTPYPLQKSVGVRQRASATARSCQTRLTATPSPSLGQLNDWLAPFAIRHIEVTPHTQERSMGTYEPMNFVELSRRDKAVLDGFGSPQDSSTTTSRRPYHPAWSTSLADPTSIRIQYPGCGSVFSPSIAVGQP